MTSFVLEPILARRGDQRALKIADRVAREIVDLIVEHELPEGARLPNEREMGEAFGISRGTMREALRLLESWGILTIRAGRDGGPIVRYPRSEALAEGLSAVLRLRRVDVSDLLVARRAIEPELARLAVTHVNAEQLKHMMATVDIMRSPDCNSDQYLEANTRFHMLVAESARSMPLQIFSESLKTIADGAVSRNSTATERVARRWSTHTCVSSKHCMKDHRTRPLTQCAITSPMRLAIGNSTTPRNTGLPSIGSERPDSGSRSSPIEPILRCRVVRIEVVVHI